MKKNAVILIESLIAFSLFTFSSLLFLDLLKNQYIQQKEYEKRLYIEEAMQRKIRHPSDKVLVTPWNEEIIYETTKDKIIVKTTVDGKTYQHQIRRHTRRNAD